jgi:hypothetical protein
MGINRAERPPPTSTGTVLVPVGYHTTMTPSRASKKINDGHDPSSTSLFVLGIYLVPIPRDLMGLGSCPMKSHGIGISDRKSHDTPHGMRPNFVGVGPRQDLGSHKIVGQDKALNRMVLVNNPGMKHPKNDDDSSLLVFVDAPVFKVYL